MMTSVEESENGATPQHRHMMPCACHCEACRALGHGNTCVVLRLGLMRLFHGKADIVDQILRHCHGASAWGTARFDAVRFLCAQYGPGDVIVLGGQGGRVQLICAQTGEKMLCLRHGHRAFVKSVSWNHDGTKLVSGSNDHTLKIWDPATGECLWTLSGHSEVNPKCTCRRYYDEDGDDYITADPDCPEKGHRDMVQSVHFCPDGTRIISGGLDKAVRIWDAASGEQLCSIQVDSPVQSVAYSADGTKFAVGLTSLTNGVLIFDARTNEQLCALNVDEQLTAAALMNLHGQFSSVAFSVDGSKLAAAFRVLDEDGGALASGVKIFSNQGSTGYVSKSTLQLGTIVTCVSYAPSGDILAVGDFDGDNGNIHLFNSQGEKTQSPVSVDDQVQSVAFSVDGSKLAVVFSHGGFEDGGIKILTNQGSAGFVCQSTLHLDFALDAPQQT